MFEKGVTSRNIRGRGRGRSREFWQTFSSNSSPVSGPSDNRSTWVRGDCLINSTENQLVSVNDHLPPSRSGGIQFYRPQIKKEDWRSFKSPAKTPPRPPIREDNSGDDSSYLHKQPLHKLTHQNTPTFSTSAGPAMENLSLVRPADQKSSADMSANSASAQPEPLLASSFSSNRKRFPTKPLPSLMESKPLLQKPSHNFRQDLNIVRSQLQQPQFSSGAPSWPFSQRKPKNLEINSSNQGKPRKAVKRPIINQGPSVLSEKDVKNKSTIEPSLRPNNGPQNKKKMKKKKIDSEGVISSDKTKLVNPELYKLTVSGDKTFAEQAEELIAQLEQTDADRQTRLQVIKDVADTFSSHLPNVTPQIYGSTFTGVAFKSSDLDIFLYCPEGQPEYNFVLEKGRVMYKSPLFKNVVRVARARVPVIKATHVATNVDVDISTRSGQAVCNSQLVKHILSLDARIRPLAMLISLWSKLNTVTGPSRFTSYSIVLMLIYYLQKVDPPILPPLKDILELDNDREWPTNFLKKEILTRNTTEIRDLFKGFFVFYSNFNFRNFIISPFLGDMIPKSHFIDTHLLGDDFIIYKNKLADNGAQFKISSFILVQDPMEHNVNTTKGVFHRLFKLFRKCCERTLYTCHITIPENRWLPITLKQLPLKLTDEKRTELIMQYPTIEENWFENCKKNFREMLKILLIKVVIGNVELIQITEEEFVPAINSDDCNNDRFYAESGYNVFNKKFRFPLRMYLNGTIHLNELQKQFEMVINRIQSSAILFKATFSVEKLSDRGEVKITITDKNPTGLNSFLSVVPEFKRYCGKFLTDLVKLGISSDSLVNNIEVQVSDFDNKNETES